jgi:hypothetical protein
MREQIIAFALFGGWTVVCVLVGAGLQYRRQRGDHQSAGVQAAFEAAVGQLRSLVEKVRKRQHIPPDQPKEPEL